MANHVYGNLEITGSSPESSDQAIRNAVEKAATMVTNMRWMEVLSTRGHLVDGKVADWQVTIKIGHTLD